MWYCFSSLRLAAAPARAVGCGVLVPAFGAPLIVHIHFGHGDGSIDNNLFIW